MFVKKLRGELAGLIWTLAGIGLVLITLSGSTRDLGTAISVGALVLFVLAVVTDKTDD